MAEGQGARAKLEARLGKDLAEQYREIEAPLALIDSRMEVSAGDVETGLQRLFVFDTLRGKKAVSRAVLALAAPVLWAATKLKYSGVKQAEKRLVYSSTFLTSTRYPAAREQIEQAFGCTAAVTFLDTLKLGYRDGGMKKILQLDQGTVRPVFLGDWSVCGGGLRRAAVRYAGTAYGAGQDREALAQALSALEAAYTKRVRRLEKRLGKETLTLYTTVNQYNLRDLLMIHACKNWACGRCSRSTTRSSSARTSLTKTIRSPGCPLRGNTGSGTVRSCCSTGRFIILTACCTRRRKSGCT